MTLTEAMQYRGLTAWKLAERTGVKTQTAKNLSRAAGIVMALIVAGILVYGFFAMLLPQQLRQLVQLQHRHRAVGADHRQHQQSAQARRPPGHRHEGIGADPALGRRQRGQGLTEHALARRTGRQLVEIDAVLVRP